MLQTINLTKIYSLGKNKVKALDKVNLSVEKGEFAAIMGSSGSGKSTLLHMIAGVDMPSAGKVMIEGKDITHMSLSEQAAFRRHKIGIVYQAYNLIPTLTVEENIILPQVLDKKNPKKEEVEELLELLGLKDRRKHLPNQLSGGQQQRTAIGRALLAKPAILLADEPTGNLDSRNTEEILDLLCKANQNQNQTILIVTHDPEVGNLAKRQITMKDGTVVSDSKADGNSFLKQER